MTPALILCAVLSITDGDTLRADCGDGPDRIRIADIDTPERGEPGAAEATAALRAWIAGREIGVAILYRDRWGRAVARVTLDGAPLDQALLAARKARPFPHDARGRRVGF